MQIEKKYWFRKSQIATLSEGPQTLQIFVSLQLRRFAICGPPTSANFPLVSTTPAVPVGKFTVSLIPMGYLDLRISQRIFEKIHKWSCSAQCAC
jgi:hypothetical protein